MTIPVRTFDSDWWKSSLKQAFSYTFEVQNKSKLEKRRPFGNLSISIVIGMRFFTSKCFINSLQKEGVVPPTGFTPVVHVIFHVI